ncbi:MAG: alcohol dehydrogenase catalytic domain-containing protein [Fimbriimonadaceae bacterium]|nr:alcohol dehydrogenase catalytic domain-containing protein [Fimbriimonadaceae bacterium]
MKLARYVGNGRLEIVDEPTPEKTPGGLIVRTEACGLCSGELMGWYMDRKIPHVIGHEVAGIVEWSDDPRFPIGARVFPHHHAPCMDCGLCKRGQYVHCPQWKSTKLQPGGMAEYFHVSKENLNDTMIANQLRPVDAALIEPVACVMKAFSRVPGWESSRVAVIGLGAMGLGHMLVAHNAVGYDINPARLEWAKSLGLDARKPEDKEPADTIFVCPGNQSALDLAFEVATPGARIVLFAPFPPGSPPTVDWDRLYFQDYSLITSYSCGPDDTQAAMQAIADGKVKAEQIVSHFVSLDELPKAYEAMKRGEILKAMVVFD